MKASPVKTVEELLSELISQQQTKLYQCALQILPNITQEDLLHPIECPELEYHPLFRYEEGIVEGLMSARMALRAENLANFQQ